MPGYRWHLVPVGFVLISVLFVLYVAYTAGPLLGSLERLLYLSCGLSLAALVWFRREVSENEGELEAEKGAPGADYETAAENLETLKREVEAELEKRSRKVRKQERELADKLAKYQEWMEFPFFGGSGDATDDGESDEDAAERFRKLDERVLALIQERSERIFERIKAGEYLVAGEFERDRLYADLLDLFESVARVYTPDSKNPILETSLEHLLRAVNRIALQMLVLLEQLPFNFKTYNIRKAYDTVQTAVRYYDTYKSVMPYWDYLRPVYYLGRLAMGATPATLGASWAITELATRGVKKLSSHLANQYALSLLHDLVFVVGSEAASIYGGDFRRREPNWIYGVELTDLIRRFPPSREVLKAGLNEIGQLHLRSEYDRIFLYRCLTAGKSAEPARFEAAYALSREERRTIAERLERFCADYIHGATDDIAKWKADVEERLRLKLNLLPDAFGADSAAGAVEKRRGALRSLAGFLVTRKGKAPEDLPALLGDCELSEDIDEAERRSLLVGLMADPPAAFEMPNLDPADPLVETWLREWMRFCVEVHPHDVPPEAIIGKIVHFYRRKDEKALVKRLNQMYAQFLADRLSADSPERKLKPVLARAFLGLLGPDESPLLIYEQVRPGIDEGPENAPRTKGKCWLLATDRGMKVVNQPEDASDGALRAIWTATPEEYHRIRIQCLENRFSKDCRLIGGRWAGDATEADEAPPSVRVAGRTMVKYETYFRPLFDLISAPA